MNTSQDNSEAKSQFQLPKKLFHGVEEQVYPPATNWQGTSLNVTGRHPASPVPPLLKGEQGRSQLQLPAQSGQHEAQLFQVTDKHGTSQFRALIPTMSAMSASETGRQSVPFASPDTGRQSIPQWQPPETGSQNVPQWQLPDTGRQKSLPPMVPPVTDHMAAYRPPIQDPMAGWESVSAYRQPVLDPMAGWESVPQSLAPATKKRGQRSVKSIVLIANAVLAVLLIVGALTTWMLFQHTAHPQVAQKRSASPTQITVTATPALNSITNNKTISPLLFGTNMGLYNATEEPMLYSAQTRQMLKQIGVRAIRMPTRPTLSDQTETAAAQAIKDVGAVPLVVIAGPGYTNGPILQTNQHTLGIITKVFGSQPVYYEFGNESDLAGITAQQYVTAWNQFVPVLKQQFPTARFIGPDNYQFTRNYLTAFLQQADPLPDGVSWHEYACSIHWSAQVCLQNVDAWNVHFAQARAAMQEAVGKPLPIWITEWNYASDTNGQLVNDGKSNNPSFMQAWTQKAMQTLVANRIFAAMQYYATDAPMPLVSNDQIGMEGQLFQAAYKKVMVDGTTPQMATITYPTSSQTVNPRDAFSFEDGTTDGWSVVGAGITAPVNSTALAFDGRHALQFTLTNANETDTPFIAVDANRLPTAPKAGQTLTAYLYVTNKSALVNAKIFVAEPGGAWIFANSLTLTPGHWNKIWLGVPDNFSARVVQLGIQFFTSSPGVSSNVYFDGIGWQ